MSWIKVYNKDGSLKRSFRINQYGEIQSSYIIENNMFFRFNKNNDKPKFQIKILKNEIDLLEGSAEHVFYRYIKKNTSKSIEIPECLYNLEVEDKMILNFNISKNKLKIWKKILKN